jgi:hypothetical protein
LPIQQAHAIRRFSAACMAVAWVANPFALSFVWFHQLLTEVTWAVLPWLLIYLSVAIHRSRPVKTYAPLIVIVSVLGSSGFTLSYLPGIVILLTAFAIAFVIHESDRLAALRGAFIFLGFWVIAISWWVLPSLAALKQVYADEVARLPPLSELLYASHYSSIANVASLTAVPQLYAGWGGVRYISWAPLVTSNGGLVLRFVLPATAIAGAIYGVYRKETRSLAITCLACSMGAIFLSKGLNPPITDFNLALLQLPFGGSFRHPVDKLAVLLIVPMCALFGLGVAELLRDRVLLPIGLAAAVIVSGLLTIPWWSGTVIPDGGGLIPSARVAVPPSYETTGLALSKGSTGGKTMVLPYSLDQASAFRWGSGIQPNGDCLFQDWAPFRTLVCHRTGNIYANRVGDTITAGILRGDPRVLDLAWLWGVDSWLVHEDWAVQYMPTPVQPVLANAFLENPTNKGPLPKPAQTGVSPRQGLHLMESTSQLRLWQQRALPLLYAAQSYRLESGPFSSETMLSGAEAVSADPSPVVLVGSGQDSLVIDSSSTTSWTMDSPTRFHGALGVNGATVLVFLQTYDPGWRLVVDGHALPASSHVQTDGFANGWVISGKGTLQWTLTYSGEAPLRVAYATGAGLFVGALAIVLVALVGRRSRSRRASG